MSPITRFVTMACALAPALVVQAAPQIFERASCNADNCLRAIRATAAPPGAAVGSADCSSFFAKTVTPCPTTKTVTATTTRTAVPATVTATNVKQSTTVVTKVSVETDTTTIIATETDPTTVFETFVATIMPIEPVTLTEVATVTVVAPTLKRDVAKVWPMRRDHPEYNVGERAVTTIPGTCPATKAPTAVPTYASACSGTARYSSACSCIGVTGKTTTLPVTTVTVTKTDTASVTPTNTVTATIVHGNTATVVVASTTVIDVTVTTTVFVTQEMDTTATVVLPITETIDVTLTETDIITAIPPPPPPTVIPPPPPPTAAPAPPIPTNFVIQAQSGPSNGLYFASSSNTADSTGFTPDAGSGTVYTIQPNRYLTVLSSGLIVNTDLLGQQHQHVHTNTKADIHASGFAALICSIEPTTLTLSCEAERSPGQNSFYSCPLDAGTAPFVGHLGVSTNGCIGFTAKVVAA